MLVLNTTPIVGSDLKVAATLPLAGQDVSGQSSYANTAETGDKPKSLSISLLIRFNDVANLSALVAMAQAKSDVGERITYNIQNETATAMAIRQVRFLGDFSVREDESLKLWRVSFKLIEVMSVPQVKESRQQSQAVTDLVPTGKTVAATDSVTPKVADLSTFENVLAWIEKQLVSSDSGVA